MPSHGGEGLPFMSSVTYYWSYHHWNVNLNESSTNHEIDMPAFSTNIQVGGSKSYRIWVLILAVQLRTSPWTLHFFFVFTWGMASSCGEASLWDTWAPSERSDHLFPATGLGCCGTLVEISPMYAFYHNFTKKIHIHMYVCVFWSSCWKWWTKPLVPVACETKRYSRELFLKYHFCHLICHWKYRVSEMQSSRRLLWLVGVYARSGI